MRTFNNLVLAVSWATASLGALYTEPSQLPHLTYDYVIVGAGTAGNVIASRLSENSLYSILVLEAGISAEDDLATIVPLLIPTLPPNSPHDWNYTITPQSGLDGRAFPYRRGRLLGGSSTINFMIHQYGSSEDFDKIAEITNDVGWKWDSLKQHIEKHEKIVPPADGHNTSSQYVPAIHSTNGIMPVSLAGRSQSIDARVIATTKEMPHDFPFNKDMGGGDVLGLGWIQSSIGGGKRSSSATSYLAAAINRPNVHVLINAQVTKLLHTGSLSAVPSFRAVQFARKPGAPQTVVKARKEIILSAGSIGTPQILLLSGIGPKAELQALNIPVVVDNPSVGQNLSDHIWVPNNYKVRDEDSLDDFFRDPLRFSSAMKEWHARKTGIFAGGITNNLGFFRLPSNASIFSTTRDPASGLNSAHWEMVVANFYLNYKPGVVEPVNGSYMTIQSALISSTSRGAVKLISADPFAHPLINPNYLTTPFDIFTMREAVKATKRFVSADAWRDYIESPVGGVVGTEDADIDAYVRDQALSMLHATGTASISPKGASWGVVEPDLKVKGVDGVRIVDASILPFPPSAHTQGPVYLIAERASQLIVGENLQAELDFHFRTDWVVELQAFLSSSAARMYRFCQDIPIMSN
ncbi:uncharacterized protein LACBIDRAFT_299608 [Laccaria bicolor S238N-H82]|uniref:pyranose dehydrogenase (acceptor) n=1 Tax=Laccaria bicolor (strain S238N-H82 / ATCC MYA-4686) TaxID=486041 RepID=B0DEZ0_LACBS|nr:uncharacterized protein LACBIDRAFT_299608 [Laccaria bicolor S238N-H82]EDR06631.1 predicted protein [Laccaria bicolor S238N-H82]|eukprot:XP_001882478.1 predicted protein [Laccaria bicolor S238N-H82]